MLGLFLVNASGDDVEVYTDESRSTGCCPPCATCANRVCIARACRTGRWGTSSLRRSSGVPDYVGAFAVTAGIGLQEKAREFQAVHDDYSAILLESLADRLAEAFAERLHERVRREFWGYAADEHLDSEGLLKERYDGIRPAPGYPACPDHTEGSCSWELLDVEGATGIRLTESMAMWPAAAVSGWYRQHLDSQYFVVGRLGKDQVEEYAARKGLDLVDAERWLAPNLGYEPEDERPPARCCGTWTAPSSTPSPTGSRRRVRSCAEPTAARGCARARLAPGRQRPARHRRYIREHLGIGIAPAADRRRGGRQGGRPGEAAVPWRPGAPRPAARPPRRTACDVRWSPCRSGASSGRSWTVCRRTRPRRW